jgi:hypothetical protein
MLSRILTAGTLAGTTLLSPLASPAGAEEVAAKSVAPNQDSEHCISSAAGAAATAVATAQSTCFPTLDQARAAVATRGNILVATHYKKNDGLGETHSIYAPSCATQWNPAGTWPGTLSSTRVTSSCTGAKHYTNANCSGSYQIVAPDQPVDLAGVLNNNVGCVKYS